MTGLMSKIATALALGLPNITRLISYRLGIKLGLNPVRNLQAVVPQGPFFQATTMSAVSAPPVATWQTSALLFSHWPYKVGSAPPDWLSNAFTGEGVKAPLRPWWNIPDFDPAIGDIKLVWELSRMDWVLAFAQRARNGDSDSLTRLNAWLDDWCAQNPPYLGPNWKCGQEASMRVMHLAMAALIMGQVQHVASGLRDLVRLHLRRIAPTVQYAMAQDNNHGTSEAAALFIGGSWLGALGETDGAKWQKIGRRWLENRAARLIGEDGSFSQYSLNYHRVMLDTYCMVEVWRHYLSLPGFSILLQARALAATQWLFHMISPVNGDGPNLGANDGARLLQLTDTDYRDYRPTVQLSMALFASKRAYAGVGSWNYPLFWLGVSVPHEATAKSACYLANDGGFAMLRRGEVFAMLRYPRLRFRPGQADALHLDLWQGPDNLLRDAGSYSYNTDVRWLNYFGGTASHNTVQFDDRDQMPRLGRFLFGNWLRTSFIEPMIEEKQVTHFAAGYRDSMGGTHRRRIGLEDARLTVEDEVVGFTGKAVLRWRLIPGSWQLEGSCLTNGLHTLTVCASVPITRCEIVEGWESRHYLEKTPVPVLEVEVRQAGFITTEYCWTV